MKEMVRVRNGHVITTSREVAAHFKKQHKNVLSAIMGLETPPEFSRLNFKPTEYKDAQGKMRPVIEMTRDGFTILAMGFTGADAMKFKIAYLTAFNRMENAIRSGNISGNLSGNIPLLRSEILRANRIWAKIKRYHEIGLNQTEIATLLKRAPFTICRHMKRMKACGLISSTKRIQTMQLQIFTGGGA